MLWPLIVIAVLVVCCGGLVPSPSADTSSQHEMSDTSSPSATPDPQVIRELAATALVSATPPYTGPRHPFEDQGASATTLPARQQYCTNVANKLQARLIALQNITFPRDTVTHARNLVRLTAIAVRHLRTCAKDTTVREWIIHWIDFVDANDRVREAAYFVQLDLYPGPR